MRRGHTPSPSGPLRGPFGRSAPLADRWGRMMKVPGGKKRLSVLSESTIGRRQVRAGHLAAGELLHLLIPLDAVAVTGAQFPPWHHQPN